MRELKEWSAKRSGATITVIGRDATTGEAAKITDVREVAVIDVEGTKAVVAMVNPSDGDNVLLSM